MKRADLTILILRVFAGGMLFLFHGYGKLVNSQGFVGFIKKTFHMLPFPELFAWLSILSETIFAIFVAIGLFTRYSATIIVINFLFAVYYHVGIRKETFKDAETALLYLLIFLVIAISGGLRYSLDAKVLRRR